MSLSRGAGRSERARDFFPKVDGAGLNRALACAIVLTALTAGCAHGGGFAIYSDLEPPEYYEEVVTDSPGEDYTWIGGYWHWTGTDHVWIRGYWGRKPYPDYVWVPSGWVSYGGSYRFVAGRWAHRSRAPSFSYYRRRYPVVPGVKYDARPRRVVRPRR